MKRLLAALLVVLAAAPLAQAQFVIERSAPAPGSVSVPLTDTVAFAFNRDVDISTDWNTAFVYEPSDSLRLSRVAVCLNFEGSCGGGDDTPRYVRYTVEHRADTDYTWFVYAVEDFSGMVLTEPYVLRYTTASTIGQQTVSGTVGLAAQQQAAAPRLLASLRTAAAHLERHGQGRPHFAPEIDAPAIRASDIAARLHGDLAPDAAEAGPMTADHDGGHTRILLVDDFTTTEAAWDVRAGTVILGETGAFSIPYVRPGTYWPLAVRYTDGTNEEVEAIGFYDADGDGAPDSVTVGETDLTGLALTLYEFPLTSARERLTTAQEAAAAFAEDQQLVIVTAGNGARTAGTAYVWSYDFYSPTENLLTTVTVDPLETFTDTTAAPTFVTSMSPIDVATFLDSDVALQALEAEGGGEAFWASFPARNLFTTLQAGNLYWRDLPNAERTYWRVQVLAVTSSQVRVFEGFVDLASGTAVATDEPDGLPEAAALQAAAYPNPFAGTARFRFTLPQSERVTLSVYNLLGQRVAAVLSDELRAAGEHAVAWTPEALPSGVYLYRLHAGDRTATGRLVRLSRR